MIAIFNRNTLLAALAAGIIGLCGVAGPVQAQTAALPWSTTYDCPYWEQFQTGGLSCGDLILGGGWTTTNGSKEQITADANNPLGDPNSKGQRHWIGSGNGTGENDNSGGLSIRFTDSFGYGEEIWIRWYMRFEVGFTWAQYNGFKMLYYRRQAAEGGGNSNYILTAFWGDSIALALQMGDGRNIRADGHGFGVYPGDPSDGSWHSYETYMKRETSSNASDGKLKIWMNGTLVLDRSDLRHGLGMGGFLIGSNAKHFPLNTRDMYVDYDDFFVTTTTPTNRDAANNPMIGPIGWGITDETPPTVSSRVIPTSGTTFLMGFDEAVTFTGAVPTLTGCSGGATTLSYVSGSGTASLTFGVSRVVLGEETGCVNSYTQPGNGIEDIAGNDLASFSEQAVTNNSTQVAPADALLLSNVIPTSGTTFPKQSTLVAIGVTSDSAASCRIGSSAGLDWASLTAYTTTGGTTHSASYPVVAGGVYQVCSRCYSTILDLYSGDACTSFSVAPRPKKGGWR
jgi:hypothetical protein